MYKLESAYEERMLVLSFGIWISWLNMFSRLPIFLKIILYSWVEFYCVSIPYFHYGYLGGLHFLAIMNIASINMNVNVCYCQAIESFEYTYIGVVIAGSYGCPVCLHSHQQWVGIPLSSHPLQSAGTCL